MFEFMGKEINAILGPQTILIWTYAYLTLWWLDMSKQLLLQTVEAQMKCHRMCIL